MTFFNLLWAVAYAGFSKGRGVGKFENYENKRKISSLGSSPFSCQNLVTTKKKGLHSNLVHFLAQYKSLHRDLVRLCAPTFCSSCKKGGPCRTFAYNSMRIILFWRPKGGVMAPCPPLNTPLVVSMQNNSTKFISSIEIKHMLRVLNRKIA